MTMSAHGVLHVAIVTTPIDVGALLSRAQAPGVGAVSMFLGTVRDLNDGRPVSGMEYEAYAPMAESELRAIAEETCARTAGLRLVVEHRVGTLEIGEASVAIVAAHAHRAQAMDGARDVIEALKQRVPIWKREHYVSGDREWIDPTKVRA
ncbi:molybdenum cofactor biosynthesis protein MoaE [Gemmatimonas groenlandica]|uniref:Molybdopterin synthase catalytic subunit n=2 Tax=Gemmatimonas groenlandica TaxID=2732249 RepID=A0A6M4IMN5_9BACT|nr:molybdenum cofactor biosynthesis protein MoaE [Gemmatimonas groenlandica]